MKPLYKYIDVLFSFTKKKTNEQGTIYFFCFILATVVNVTSAGHFRRIKLPDILVLMCIFAFFCNIHCYVSTHNNRAKK